tara:strand:- start:748 stop:1512 length:765 start_codon:yes stop_codon:yes gene_type:complete
VNESKEEEKKIKRMPRKRRPRKKKQFKCPICLDEFSAGKMIVCCNGHKSACTTCYGADLDSGRSSSIQFSGGQCGLCRGAIHDQDQNHSAMSIVITDSYNKMVEAVDGKDVGFKTLGISADNWVKFNMFNYSVNKRIRKYFKEPLHNDRWKNLTGTSFGLSQDTWCEIYKTNWGNFKECYDNDIVIKLSSRRGKKYMKDCIDWVWLEAMARSQFVEARKAWASSTGSSTRHYHLFDEAHPELGEEQEEAGAPLG